MKKRKVIELVNQMLQGVEAAVVINGNITSNGARAAIESSGTGTFIITGTITANSDKPTLEVK